MSVPDNETPRPGALPEEEHLPYGRVVAVGVASLVVFTLATLWAVSILRSGSGRVIQDAVGIPAELGQPEIGIVDQEQFEHVDAPARLRREQLGRLSSYGWVDRDAGIIHVPIDVAIQRFVEERAR